MHFSRASFLRGLKAQNSLAQGYSQINPSPERAAEAVGVAPFQGLVLFLDRYPGRCPGLTNGGPLTLSD